MTATLTKSAFAKHIKRSASYVTALRHAGRLVLNARGQVMVAESLALMAASAGGREDVAERHAKGRSGTAATVTLPDDGVGRGESKALATARKEAAQADIAEMERDEKRGNLIPRDDVDTAFKFVGAAFASLLDNLPGQNAAVLAPITTPEAMEDALVDLCHTLRQQFGDAIHRQQAAIAERRKA